MTMQQIIKHQEGSSTNTYPWSDVACLSPGTRLCMDIRVCCGHPAKVGIGAACGLSPDVVDGGGSSSLECSPVLADSELDGGLVACCRNSSRNDLPQS